MRIFKFIVSFVIIILLSISVFLWTYQEVGFNFTALCLFSWAFVIAAWAVVVWLFLLTFDDDI